MSVVSHNKVVKAVLLLVRQSNNQQATNQRVAERQSGARVNSGVFSLVSRMAARTGSFRCAAARWVLVAVLLLKPAASTSSVPGHGGRNSRGRHGATPFIFALAAGQRWCGRQSAAAAHSPIGSGVTQARLMVLASLRRRRRKSRRLPPLRVVISLRRAAAVADRLRRIHRSDIQLQQLCSLRAAALARQLRHRRRRRRLGHCRPAGIRRWQQHLQAIPAAAAGGAARLICI